MPRRSPPASTVSRLRGGWALPVLGGVLALVLAGGFLLLMPDPWLETLTGGRPPAGPPVDGSARAMAAAVAAAAAGAVAWSVLYLLFGPGGTFHRGAGKGRAATAHAAARRPGAHPPSRPPLTAPDPLPPVERALPADLDQPLSAFDPGAIPRVPRAPMRPTASIGRAPSAPRAADRAG